MRICSPPFSKAVRGFIHLYETGVCMGGRLGGWAVENGLMQLIIMCTFT